jgi:lipopolysaccharide transport system permease protein
MSLPLGRANPGVEWRVFTLMTRSNYAFLLSSLVARDFKIRYRNMSLGIFWSLLNPLVMMGVLWFVFTRIYPLAEAKDYHLVVLSGLVVFNFFSLGWSTGTVSLLANANLIKRVPIPREVVPISTVLANALHFLIQVCFLLALVLAAGRGVNRYWLWIPVILFLELLFICGISLITSALDVYFRDVRYVVESTTMVMFWLVPIFYGFAIIPEQYHWVYRYNPVAAVVILMRKVLLENSFEMGTVRNLALVSTSFFLAGLWLFGRMKQRFADYL